MTKPISFGKLDVGLTTGPSSGPATARRDEPLRIPVLGNFRGDAGSGWATKYVCRRHVRLDLHNLDDVIAKLEPQFRLSVTRADAGTATFRFAALDDFHPNPLYQKVEVFDHLRSLRRRFQDNATF